MLQVLNKIDLPGAEPDRVVREIEEVGAKKLKDSMSIVCVAYIGASHFSGWQGCWKDNLYFLGLVSLSKSS